MKPIDLKTVLKGKQGWVSISKNYKDIIAEADTLKELLEKLKKMGNPEGFITTAQKDYSRYVG